MAARTTTAPVAPGAAPRAPGSNQKWWALAATCFGLFMALLDVTVVNVALPTIQRDLHASFADLQWVINAYTIALAVVLVTAGRLGDVFGRKRVFMTGLGIFTLGSLLCALSGNFSIGGLSHVSILLGARVIQGVGGSIMLPLSLAIISATFHGKERGAAIGIWGGVSGLATAIGPVVGGILVQQVNWQSIFYLNVPIGIVGIVLTAWAVRESRDERAPRAVDVFGLVASAVSIFCLVLALIQGNDQGKGWTSPYILTLFAVAAVALIAFVVVELRLKNPMVDPRLFLNRSYTGAAICAFTLSAGLYALFFFLALYFQNFLAFAALATGLRFLPLSAPNLIGAPLSGALTDRVGPRPLLVAGMVIITGAVLWMVARISPGDHQSDWVGLIPAFLLAGLGSGLVNPPISTLAVGTASRARAGMASAVNNVCRQVGTAFGIAFLGAVLTGRYNGYIHDKVMALHAPFLTATIRQNIISGVQKAGTVAGSLGLPNDPAHPNPYAGTALYHQVQQVARAAFVQGLDDILKVAAVIVAIGVVAAALLVRRSDLLNHAEGERNEGAGSERNRSTGGERNDGQYALAEKRSEALMGLTLALMAREARRPDASPRLLARLAAVSDGRYPRDWSTAQRARAVADDLVQPLAAALLAASVVRRKGGA